MRVRVFQHILYCLLFISVSAAAQTAAPQLPGICPDLSKDGMFNPVFWQIQLQPLANEGQLQTNLNINKMQGDFQGVIWSHYVVCNYVDKSQTGFSLKSKFITTQPSLPSATTLTVSNKGWQSAGYVILCTSTDPKDCPFQATYLMQQTPASQSSDLLIQQPDKLPHAPTD